MKTGLIGCGNIGKEIAKYIDSSEFFDLMYIHDLDEEKIEWISNSLKRKPKSTSFNELIENSEFIIEAASVEAVKRILKQNLIGKKVMIMSAGGLIEEDIPKSSEIYIPSGAISGIDALKSVSGKIENLTITTTKPSKGLPSNNINKKTVIFEGNLKEAIAEFPKNINVAATIFLATNKEPKIKIIVDPNAKTNTHEITALGSFGKITTKTENIPSDNPKTSYLAILSAVQCLKNIESNIKIG